MTKNERKDCKTLVEEAKKNKRRNFRETTYTGSGELQGPIIKHKGNQSVNNTNYKYEKLDITEEMLVLYTNADCLPNKLHELKQLIVHLETSPDIISVTEIKHKHKWEMNSAELIIDGYHMFTNDLEGFWFMSKSIYPVSKFSLVIILVSTFYCS